MIRGSLCLLLSLTVGCSALDEEIAPGPEVPPQAEAEAILYGSGDGCQTDETCLGASCRMGRCVGLLLTDSVWLQRRMAQRVRARVAAAPELKGTLLGLVNALHDDPGASPVRKGRTIPLLEALDVTPPLEALAAAADRSLAESASLALCRLGKPRFLQACAALTEHDHPATAVAALGAMGRLGVPEALDVLLRTLNPDLDRHVLKATLEALDILKDPRSIRPIVAFLPDCPPFLRQLTVRVLRNLTGAKLGKATPPWRAWVASNNPPKAPTVTLREARSEDVLGIPTP